MLIITLSFNLLIFCCNTFLFFVLQTFSLLHHWHTAGEPLSGSHWPTVPEPTAFVTSTHGSHTFPLTWCSDLDLQCVCFLALCNGVFAVTFTSNDIALKRIFGKWWSAVHNHRRVFIRRTSHVAETSWGLNSNGLGGGGLWGSRRRGRGENSLCLAENISFHQQHILVQPHFVLFLFQCSSFCRASAMDFSGGELHRQLFSVSLRHGQPHSIFRGWVSVHGIFICPNSGMATSTRQFVTHTQMFMHAMARRGSRHTVRVCALKVDSGSRSLVAAAESAYRSCRHTVRECELKVGSGSR